MLPHMNGRSLQSPLRPLSVLVFHLLLTHSCRGQSQVISPPQPLVAKLGDDIILPCHLEPAMDVAAMTLEWKRSDLDRIFVYVWRAGQEAKHVKHPSYKDRTSLFTEELKLGNISLKLSRVKLSDRGTYECYIPEINARSVVELVVASGAVSSPVVTLAGIDRDSRGVMIDCESRGWYPEPEVLWLDGEGNLLSAGPTETNRGPDELYTVSSRVTVEKRHSNSFTCRVHQKNTNQTRETHIHVPEDFFELQSSSSVPTITGLAVSLAACIIVFILIILFVVWKWRQNIIKTKRVKQEREREQLMKDGTLQTEREKTKCEKRLKQQLLEEVQTLKKDLETKNNEVETQQAKLQQLHEEKQRNQKELQDLKKELETKNNEVETQQAKLQQLHEEKQRNQKELQDLKKELETKNNELHEEKQRREEAEREVQTLKEDLQTKNNEVETQRAELQQLHEEKQRNQKELQNLKNKNTKLQNEERATNIQWKKTNEELKEAKDQLEKTKKENSHLKTKMEKLLQDEKKKENETERDMKQLMDRNMEWQKKLQEETKKRDEAEKKLEELKEQLGSKWQKKLQEETKKREEEEKKLKEQLEKKLQEDTKKREAEKKLKELKEQLEKQKKFHEETTNEDNAETEVETVYATPCDPDRTASWEHNMNSSANECSANECSANESSANQSSANQSSANQSSATGPAITIEVNHVGKYIRLRNRSYEDQQLEGWNLEMQVNNNNKPIKLIFEESYELKSGKAVKITGPVAGRRYVTADLWWKDLKPWTNRDKLQFTLISKNGDIQHQLTF